MGGFRHLLGAALSLMSALLPAQEARLEEFRSALLARTVRISLHVPSVESVALWKERHPGFRFRLVLFLPGYFDGPKDLIKRGLYQDLADREKAGELAPSLWVAVTHFHSWYVDRKDGTFPYQRFLVDELLPGIEQRFPGFGGTPEARTVAGLSMGGFGALNLCGRTSLFSRCLAMSPALVEPPFDRAGWFIRHSLERALPADEAAFRPFNVRFHLAGRAEVHLTAGTDEGNGIDQGVRELGEALRSQGRAVEVTLKPGRHDWNNWTPEIKRQAPWLTGTA